MGDVKLDHGQRGDLHIVYLNLVLLSCLHVKLLVHHVYTLPTRPIIDQGVAIDDDSHLIVGRDIKMECLCARGAECTLIAGREMVKVYAGGKNRGTTVTLVDRFAMHHLRCWCADHVLIIPISGLHARLAVV